MFKFIKEYFYHKQYKTKRFIVRTDCYNSDLSHFILLFQTAKKDFPDLKEEQVEIKHYGGMTYKGTYGIEFNLDPKVIPVEYEQIHKLEYTL